MLLVEQVTILRTPVSCPLGFLTTDQQVNAGTLEIDPSLHVQHFLENELALELWPK